MVLPNVMHAALVRECGGIENIEYARIPVPPIGPTDVLVRLEASEVNHVDRLVFTGAYETYLPMPFVIGRDLVGRVTATGSGVTGFAPGHRVWSNSLGHHGRQGAWSEYVVVSADRLYPAPANLPAGEVAAVLHGAGTAWIGLVRETRLVAGETLVIEGGGGAVGSAVIQMARGIGAHVITTASPEDGPWCKSCGADVVLDYHRDDLYAELGRLAPEGIDVWWDASGHNRLDRVLPLLSFGGRAVIMSGLGHESVNLPVGDMYTRDITLHGFAISNASVSDLATAAKCINRLLATGRLQNRIALSYGLADAALAHQALLDGKLRGRVVVVPDIDG